MAKKSTKKKATAKKSSAKKDEAKELKKALDPKQREVLLLERGKKFQVQKPATGFKTSWLAKATAEKEYKHQTESTNNQ